MSNNCLRKQKKLYSFLLFLLVGTVLLFFEYTHPITFGLELDNEPLNKIYRRGKSTLELRIFPDNSGLAVKNFNHPYYFKKSTIVDILSSIYYKDKDAMQDIMKSMVKIGKKEKRIFQGDEIEKLAPLIMEAFSKAKPEQDLLVSSYSERFLLEGLNNVFSLFMTGDKLNIAFGQVRHRGNVSKSPVLKARGLKQNIEPTKVEKSHFWELVPSPGQQFEPNHKNWLIIDFRNELFTRGVEKRREKEVQKYDKKLKPIVDPLEERIRKLEESLAKGDKDHQSVETPPQSSQSYSTREKPYDSKETGNGNVDLQLRKKEDISAIREKFYALDELLKEDLITYIDYEEKKHELLLGLQEHNVKTSLKELKKLKDMGFITNDDFENTKLELLKKF